MPPDGAIEPDEWKVAANRALQTIRHFRGIPLLNGGNIQCAGVPQGWL